MEEVQSVRRVSTNGGRTVIDPRIRDGQEVGLSVAGLGWASDRG